MYEITYNFKVNGEVIPAMCCCFAYEVASILRNMAHMAIMRGYQFSNVTLKKK